MSSWPNLSDLLVDAGADAPVGLVGSSRYPVTYDIPENRAFVSAFQAEYKNEIPDWTDGEMYQALITESKKIGTFGHGFTYSGHPVSAAVAIKTLEIYQRDKIIEGAAARAPQFQQRLNALGDHPLVGETRGIGLVGALELAAHKPSKTPFDAQKGVGARVVANAQAEGLIVRFIAGDVISICPPLIIKPAEIDELFDKLGRALDKTLDWAKQEQLLAA